MMADLQDHERRYDPELVDGPSMAEAHVGWLLDLVERQGGFVLVAASMAMRWAFSLR
ncbi:MAG: hypothetical protein R3C97_01315 [Geminicoccaceae bacterium]